MTKVIAPIHLQNSVLTCKAVTGMSWKDLAKRVNVKGVAATKFQYGVTEPGLAFKFTQKQIDEIIRKCEVIKFQHLKRQ